MCSKHFSQIKNKMKSFIFHIYKKANYIFILLFAVIFITYIGIYFIHFNRVSNNIEDYANFGTYIGGLGSIASVFTLIIILLENRKLVTAVRLT